MWHLQSPKNGMFVPFEKRQENQISLSYQILPLVLKLLLRPMLGELGFQGDNDWTKVTKITKMISRWWFQIFFIFIPTWGNDPIWRSYFSIGLKPPTWFASGTCTSFRSSPPRGVEIPRPSATEQLDPFNDPVGTGMRETCFKWRNEMSWKTGLCLVMSKWEKDGNFPH